MTISLICIGHLKDASLCALEEEYQKRLSPFCRVEIIEVKEEPSNKKTLSRPQEIELIKEKEARRALEKIPKNEFCILLDLHGKEWTSEEFSRHLSSWAERFNHLTFVIAGSYGPGKALLQRSNERWKLSSLTFTHLMTRVLVLEQIYRGFMIQNNRTYHK